MSPEWEHIELGPTRSILAFAFEKAAFDAPWHLHPQHELTLIQESQGTRFVGDYVGPYKPGEVVLLKSHLPHCWKNHPDPSQQARSVVVQWNDSIFPKIPELGRLNDLIALSSRGLHFDPQSVKALIPRLEDLPRLEGPTLYGQLLSLLLDLAHCPYYTLSEARFDAPLSHEVSNRMGKVHEYVAQHYAHKISLHQLADLVSLSEQAFSRFFSKVMGRPFFTFLNEYRCNAASRLLIETDQSVAEIAYACGYESLPFFHKQFKKYLQLSPLAYRKQHRTPRIPK